MPGVTRVVLSRRAREDLKRVWRHIAADSEAAADRVLLAIDAKVERLAMFPLLGPTRDDIRPGVRMLVHGPRLVLYDYDADADVVEIVTVVEAMRDLDGLL